MSLLGGEERCSFSTRMSLRFANHKCILLGGSNGAAGGLYPGCFVCASGHLNEISALASGKPESAAGVFRPFPESETLVPREESARVSLGSVSDVVNVESSARKRHPQETAGRGINMVPGVLIL